MKAEEDQLEAERNRLQGLFDAGDTTFTTLGVIDVNLGAKQRKAKKAKKARITASTGKENVDPASAMRDVRSSAAVAVLVAMPTAPALFAQPPVARAIAFR